MQPRIRVSWCPTGELTGTQSSVAVFTDTNTEYSIVKYVRTPSRRLRPYIRRGGVDSTMYGVHTDILISQ
jgi:hypothetical protein